MIDSIIHRRILYWCMFIAIASAIQYIIAIINDRILLLLTMNYQ
jgi:hypothetical protein